MKLNSTLAQLEAAQLVRHLAEPEAQYIFKHALTQEAAYQSLLLKQRRALHTLVAQTIEALYPDQLETHAGVLACHYADAHDDAKTCEYSMFAGDVAMRVSAYPEARAHYTQALEALTRLPDDSVNAGRRLHALIELSHASAFSDDPARNYARLVQAEELAQKLIATEPNYRWQLTEVYYWLGFMNLMRNDTRETIRYYHQARVLAQDLHNDQLAAQASFDTGVVLNIQGRFADAEALIAQGIALMEKAGKPLEDVIALAQWGVALAGRGHYAEGLVKAQAMLTRVEQIRSAYGIEVNHLLIGWIHFLGGEYMLALQSAHGALQLAQAAGDWIQVFTSSVFIAWAQNRLGQSSAALTTLAQVQPIVAQANGQLIGVEMFLAAQAESTLDAEQIEQALTLAEQTVKAAQANDALFSQGIAQRVWASALAASDSSWDEIESHLQASLAVFEQGDARIEAARTHLAWGKLLIERNDRELAKTHLEQAAAQFESSGLTRELDETRSLIAVEKS